MRTRPHRPRTALGRVMLGLRRWALPCGSAAVLGLGTACGSTNTVAPPPPPPTSGSLNVRITMSGIDVPVGVNVAVDTATPVLIASDSAFTFTRLTIGQHQVTVSGASANCTSESALVQTVNIAANTEDSLALTFDCVKAALTAHNVLAFSRADSSGLFDVWVMNADGTGETDLTNSPTSSDVTPSWTPDGSSVVFIMHGESVPEIALVHFDGSGLIQITTDSRQKATPAVSPDGSRIAFSMLDTSSHYRIWVINIDGSGLRQLTSDTTQDQEPSWSPDGTKVAFRRAIDPSISSIFVVNADGTNVQPLSAPGFYNANPSWSPNGSRIAFCRIVDGEQHIALMNPDGSNVQILTTGDAADEEPTWSPRWITNRILEWPRWIGRDMGHERRRHQPQPSLACRHVRRLPNLEQIGRSV